MKCGYKAWHIFVDLATLMWLGAFVLSFAGPDYWWTSFVLEGVGGVFVVELGVIFFCAATWRAFLKTAWLDILLLIPFLRVFRIGRVARLFRLRRAARFLTAIPVRPGLCRSL